MAQVDISYSRMITTSLALHEIYNPAQIVSVIKELKHDLFVQRAVCHQVSYRGKGPGAIAEDHHVRAAIERSEAGFRQLLRRQQPAEWRSWGPR